MTGYLLCFFLCDVFVVDVFFARSLADAALNGAGFVSATTIECAWKGTRHTIDLVDFTQTTSSGIA